MFQVRSYASSDFQQLLELNLRDVDQWRHLDAEHGLVGSEARWENLSSYERWMHGGPWLDPATLAIQISIVQHVGVLFVLEDGKSGELVGEAEIVLQELTVSHGVQAYLSWFLIDPKHRRKGLATFFLRQIMRQLREEHPSVYCLSTIPENSISEQTYTKVGLVSTRSVHECQIPGKPLWVSTPNHCSIRRREDHSFPEGLVPYCRVFYPTNYTWMHLMRRNEFERILKHSPTGQPVIYDLQCGATRAVAAIGPLLHLWVEPHAYNHPQILREFFGMVFLVGQRLNPSVRSFRTDLWGGQTRLLEECGINSVLVKRWTYMECRSSFR